MLNKFKQKFFISKKINHFINILLKKYLKKLNYNNFSKIARSNKFLFVFVALIILFLSYLLIPNVYDKDEIRKELDKQLLNKLNLNFNLSQNLNYNFFPRPHFIIKDSIIINNQNEISNIKKIKIYVSLNNLFSLENIEVNSLVVENANFKLNKNNHDFFIKLLDENFKDIIFEIKDSNVFYKNIEKEVLFINKIINAKYYYDFKNLKNIAIMKNEIFNIPYSLELYDNKNENKIYTKINLNFLKMQLENTIDYSSDIKKGFIDVIVNQKKSTANYEIKENSFNFHFFDQLDNSKFSYKGKVNFNPFYSDLKGLTEQIYLSPFFSSNSLIIELLKTEIFFNKNLNFDLNIDANKIKNYINFLDISFISKIQEGLIDIDKTNFSWKNYVDFEISDSLIYNKDNELIIDGKMNMIINDSAEIYKSLLTPKNYRNEIKKIQLNFNYNFQQKNLVFNDIKINNKTNLNVNNSLKSLIFKKDKLQNKIYLKNKINQAIKAYAG